MTTDRLEAPNKPACKHYSLHLICSRFLSWTNDSYKTRSCKGGKGSNKQAAAAANYLKCNALFVVGASWRLIVVYF